MKKRILLVLSLIFVLGVHTASAALTEQQSEEILKFTKDFIMNESKNSGIFSLQHPETGQEEWFELYGILGNIKEAEGGYFVMVDVDIFGYPDENYLLYFIVKTVDGQYKLDEIRIGPRFERKGQATQKLSIPE
ncbi:MAG: hypothetical protein AB7S78_08955 [Candidatus Omnitrophota bacterium]